MERATATARVTPTFGLKYQFLSQKDIQLRLHHGGQFHTYHSFYSRYISVLVFLGKLAFGAVTVPAVSQAK